MLPGQLVIGGLPMMTLMTLFVVPAVYSASRNVKGVHERDAEIEAMTCQALGGLNNMKMDFT
jgi:hypothetical protein